MIKVILFLDILLRKNRLLNWIENLLLKRHLRDFGIYSISIYNVKNRKKEKK